MKLHTRFLWLALVCLAISACSQGVTETASAPEESAAAEETPLPKPGEGVLGQTPDSSGESSGFPAIGAAHEPKARELPPAAQNSAANDAGEKPEAAQPQSAPAKSELVGAWMIVGGEGGPSSEARFVFGASDFSIDEGHHKQKGTYTADAAQSPKHVNIVMQEGSHQIPLTGIYELDGDSLTICLAGPQRGTSDAGEVIPVAGTRPTKFEQAQGSIVRLFRAKQMVADQPLAIIGRQMPWVSDGGIAFSADSEKAALTVGMRVLLWDLEANKKIGWLMNPLGSGPAHVALSPDGKLLAVSCGNLGQGVAVWDVETQERKLDIPDGARVTQFSPDGALLAVGGAGVPVRLFDVASGEVRFKLEGEDVGAFDLAFSSDGKLLATIVPTNNLVRLWEVETGKEVAKLEGTEGKDKRALAFQPHGNLLAVAAEYGPVELWNVEEQKMVSTLPPKESAGVLAFSPDGKTLVTGGPLKFWDVTGETPKLLGSIPPSDREVGEFDRIAFSPDGKYLGVAGSHVSRIWPLAGVNSPAAPAVFPPALSPEEQAEYRELEWFSQLRVAIANFNTAARRQLLNRVNEAGEPTFSWRASILPYMEFQIAYNTLDFKQPHDSEANAEGVKAAAPLFATQGAAPGTSTWLLATGPGTAYETPGKATSVTDGAARTIRIVKVAPKHAVPWAAPKDFVFNPDDPWAGLPKEGFVALFHNSVIRFVPGDTPPETLKALFTAAGGEEIDIEAVTRSAFDKFTYGEE